MIKASWFGVSEVIAPVPGLPCRLRVAGRLACGHPPRAIQAAAGISLTIGLLPWLPLVAAPLVGDPTRDGRSLAPIDWEAFRSRYGQEALFRLRLGVDAVREAGNPHLAVTPCPPAGWSESPERARYERELATGSYFRAGQALGAWQLQARVCAAGAR